MIHAKVKQIRHKCELLHVTNVNETETLTPAAGHHCWQSNNNFEEGMRILLLVIHDTPLLHHFNMANELWYLTVPIHLPHSPLLHQQTQNT